MEFVKYPYKDKHRLQIVDVLQGMAMLWVVIGHHLFDFMPGWYRQMYLWIYSFHMPFFIFISGFLIAYSYKGLPYIIYLYRRFRKFFVPYVAIGVVVTMLSVIREGFEAVPKSLLCLLISPKESEATFLWYIYLLFVFYAIYPVIVRLRCRWQICVDIILLSLGIVFYLEPVRYPLFCFDYFTRYFLFFVIGIGSAWYFDFLHNHSGILNLVGLVSLIAFVALSALKFAGFDILIQLSFVALPAMYGLAGLLKHVAIINKTLVWISKNCFHIYLLHMFFVQGIALLVSNMFQYGEMPVLAYLIISVMVSLVGPVVLFRLYDRAKLKFCKNNTEFNKNNTEFNE